MRGLAFSGPERGVAVAAATLRGKGKPSEGKRRRRGAVRERVELKAYFSREGRLDVIAYEGLPPSGGSEGRPPSRLGRCRQRLSGRARKLRGFQSLPAIEVREDYRRRGLATLLYDMAEVSMGPPWKCEPSVIKSEAGREFWRARRRGPRRPHLVARASGAPEAAPLGEGDPTYYRSRLEDPVPARRLPRGRPWPGRVPGLEAHEKNPRRGHPKAALGENQVSQRGGGLEV